MLLAAGVDDGLEVRGELAAALALRSMAAPTPAHAALEIAMLGPGAVGGRLDVGVVDETPECVAVFDDVATRPGIR
jgi:hypothetical protein